MNIVPTLTNPAAVTILVIIAIVLAVTLSFVNTRVRGCKQKKDEDDEPVARRYYREIMKGPVVPSDPPSANQVVASWGKPTRKTTEPEVLIIRRHPVPEIDLHPSDPGFKLEQQFKLEPRDLRMW